MKLKKAYRKIATTFVFGLIFCINGCSNGQGAIKLDYGDNLISERNNIQSYQLNSAVLYNNQIYYIEIEDSLVYNYQDTNSPYSTEKVSLFSFTKNYFVYLEKDTGRLNVVNLEQFRVCSVGSVADFVYTRLSDN